VTVNAILNRDQRIYVNPVNDIKKMLRFGIGG
jgi:hypothetical protein